MVIEELTSAEQVAAIEQEWQTLWSRDPCATPFQAPQWLLPWWSCFGSGELLVLALRNTTGSLDALAPLFILRDDDTGESLGLLVGTGSSDYLDILVAPGTDPSPLIAAIGRAACDAFDFQQLRPSSPLLSLAAPDGWDDFVEDQEPCPVLSLDAREAGGVALSTHFRKKLRYYRRTLEREGELSFDTATAESLDTILDALFDLHAARWRERGLPGVLDDPDVQRFHRRAARGLLDAGALRLYAMRIDGRPAAVFYGFAHHHTVYYYLGGFDPALEKLSPGTVLIAHAIERAAESGAATFDFLRGAESYKYAWGAADRINRRRQWARRTRRST